MSVRLSCFLRGALMVTLKITCVASTRVFAEDKISSKKNHLTIIRNVVWYNPMTESYRIQLTAKAVRLGIINLILPTSYSLTCLVFGRAQQGINVFH